MGAKLGRALYTEPYVDVATVSALTTATVALMPTLSTSTLAAIQVLSLGGQFGLHFYVAMVAGPTMYFHLEKETFSFIQSKLFPKVGLTALSSAVIATSAFAISQGQTSAILDYPGHLLLSNLALNALQSLVIFPLTIASTKEMRNEKLTEEMRARAKSKFGALHGLSMSVNLATIGLNTAFIFASV